MKRTSKRMIALGAVCAVAACAFLVLPALGLFREPSFKSERWRDKRVYRANERLTMADDLIARQLLTGLTRVEVLDLLGPEEADRPFRDEHLVYYLGPERGWISIDSEWLAIRFDANNVVQEYRIVRD